MKTSTSRFAMTVCVLALAIPAGGEGQVSHMTQAEMVQALSSDDPTVRDRALIQATRLGSRAGSELRAAIIQTAWAEVRGETNRPGQGDEPGEYVLDYMHAVAGLRDPAAIPFLVSVMKHGAIAANALADFGAVALPAVLETVDAGQHADVRMGLAVLRFMVEDGAVREADLPKIREVARKRLAGRQHWRVVLGAMHLAVALADREFLDRMATLASDRASVVQLLGARSEHIRKIQQDARNLLSGDMLPYPVRKPWQGPPGAQGVVGMGTPEPSASAPPSTVRHPPSERSGSPLRQARPAAQRTSPSTPDLRPSGHTRSHSA